MNRLLVFGVLLVCPAMLLANDKADVFAELDKNIETQLSSDKWHPASKTLIRTQWAEYKQAHEKPGRRGDFHGAECYGRIVCDPVIDEIKQYAGAYNFKGLDKDESSSGPHLQIEVTADNRVFVIEEGRRIPAVVNNNIIFYTTGEFLPQNAQFGSKPYAELEIWMVYKARHFGLVTGLADDFVDDMSKLVKLDPNAKTKEP